MTKAYVAETSHYFYPVAFVFHPGLLTCPPSLLSQPATMRWADSSSLYLYEMFLTRVAAEQTWGSSPISRLAHEDTEDERVHYIYYI